MLCPYCKREITPRVTIEYTHSVMYPVIIENDLLTPDIAAGIPSNDERAGKYYFSCPECNHTLFRDQILPPKDPRKFKGNLILHL